MFLYFHAMSVITVTTPFNIDLEFRIATVGKRFLAWLIDVCVICIYYAAMVRVLLPLVGIDIAAQQAASLFLLILPVLLYQVAMEILNSGQTLGKMLTRIRVMDKSGLEASTSQYVVRWALCIGNLFIYAIPYLILSNVLFIFVFMFLYVPDAVSMVVSGKNQRLGDLAAGTMVIETKVQSDIHQTIYQAIETEAYKPSFPQVMRLTDKDINGIRNLLATKRNSHDHEVYIINVAQKIKTVLAITSDLPARDFLAQLLSDYNYFTTSA